jgi:hypothetical protein
MSGQFEVAVCIEDAYCMEVVLKRGLRGHRTTVPGWRCPRNLLAVDDQRSTDGHIIVEQCISPHFELATVGITVFNAERLIIRRYGIESQGVCVLDRDALACSDDVEHLEGAVRLDTVEHLEIIGVQKS